MNLPMSIRSAHMQLLSMARTMGVPKDIIDRNLKKASDKDQADFIEVSPITRLGLISLTILKLFIDTSLRLKMSRLGIMFTYMTVAISCFQSLICNVKSRGHWSVRSTVFHRYLICH